MRRLSILLAALTLSLTTSVVFAAPRRAAEWPSVDKQLRQA
jgi:hypothetical protein